MPKGDEPPAAASARRGAHPSFRLSLNRKFLLALLLLASVILLIAYLVGAAEIKRSVLAEAERSLLRASRMVEVALVSHGGSLDMKWVDPEADRMGRSLDARVTIIGAGGFVLGDSVLSGADLARMGDQSDRADVRLARETGTGREILRGEGRDSDQIRVSRTLDDSPYGGVIIRLTTSLSGLDGALSTLRRNMLVLAAILVVAIFLLGRFLLRRVMEDLDAITRAVALPGNEMFGVPLPKHRQDEIGQLARGLDGMAGRLRETIREVTEERNQLQAILEAMEDGVLVTDETGRIILANPALVTHLNLPQEPAGHTILDLVRNPVLHDLVLLTLKTESPGSGEIVLLRGGVERSFLVHVVPFGGGDAPKGSVALLHDVSEVRRVEKMRSDFLANVSHELKTPLASIRGYAETLVTTPPRDPQQGKSFSETILKHATRLTALVEDLLELSRIESGEMTLRIEPVGLRVCVDQIIQAIAPVARQKGLSLDVDVPESLPRLMVDRAALATVLENLVDNAVKYTPAGGHVKIRGAREGDAVRIEIIDSGHGIPPEHLGRLFERFYRVDASRSREKGGTGLGLAIVKHLIQTLGGQVGVESEPGKGSCFHVTLPAAPDARAD